MNLKLKDIPREEGGRLSVFADQHLALAHICDHLLTQPECGGWSVLLLECKAYCDPDEPNVRYELARSFWPKPADERAQVLYDAYTNVIRQAMESAMKLKWTWMDPACPGDLMAFGLSGALVIFNPRTVRSCYLPGMGEAPREPQGEGRITAEERKQNPLPREKRSREAPPSMRPPRRSDKRMHRRKCLCGPSAEGSRVKEDAYKIFRICAFNVRRDLLRAYSLQRNELCPALQQKAGATREEWEQLTSEVTKPGGGVS